MLREALGLIESKSLNAAMEVLQAATHAATVTASVELIDASFVVIKIEGELGAVQASVDAGARAAQHMGQLIAARIIPRLEAPVIPVAIKKPVTAPKAKPVLPRKSTLAARVQTSEVSVSAVNREVPMTELEAMPVVKLRQYARNLTNLPIQGRQISMANKQQLLEAIRIGRG